MTPPVLLPAAVAVAAVALGLLLGLLPSGRSRWVGPLRTLALAAALTVVLTHLLPEAFAELGLPALVLFAATVAVPAWLRLVTRVAGTPERSSSLTIGTKSLPSAPRPCIQITAAVGLEPVSSSMVSSIL